ncbi:uncharacterized protein [Ptychodera flava]|uniref:uncharacterized protein isoform X5 n=1 Tax=Ptychodera flava TaxID=63121 RepID=UPI003969C4F9
MMEVFVAKYDYERERDDVLSFKKGDKFEITHKPDDKWWAAKRIGDGCLGYVPALYLEPSKDRIVGRLIPEEVRKSEEHSVHLQALLELQKKVKPIPDFVVKKALDDDDKQIRTNLFSRTVSKKNPFHTEDGEMDHSIVSKKNSFHRDDLEKDRSIVSKKSSFHRHDVETDRSIVSKKSSFHRHDVETDRSIVSKKNSSDRDDVEQDHGLDVSDSDMNVYDDDGDDDIFVESKPEQIPYHHKCNASMEIDYKTAPEDDTTVPYHHQCIADSLGDDGEDDEDDDDLPFHLKFAPPDEAPPTPDYDLDEPYADTTPYHHKYHQHGDGPPVSPTGEEPYEGELVKPKPLPNPVRASKKHQELHRELKRVNRDGNREVLNQKPELTKAFEARRNAEKLKEIEESKKQKRTSLDIKLQKQQEKLREEEERQKQQTIEEDTKPEFMKVKLRHRADSDTGNGNKEGNGTS